MPNPPKVDPYKEKRDSYSFPLNIKALPLSLLENAVNLLAMAPFGFLLLWFQGNSPLQYLIFFGAFGSWGIVRYALLMRKYGQGGIMLYQNNEFIIPSRYSPTGRECVMPRTNIDEIILLYKEDDESSSPDRMIFRLSCPIGNNRQIYLPSLSINFRDMQTFLIRTDSHILK